MRKSVTGGAGTFEQGRNIERGRSEKKAEGENS